MAHQPGGGQHVDLQRLVPDPVPLRIVGLDAACQPHHRGVVDQNVDPAAPGHRLAPELVDLLGSAEIGADQQDASAGRSAWPPRPRRGRCRSAPPGARLPHPAPAAVAAPMPLEAPVSRTVFRKGAGIATSHLQIAAAVGFELTGLRPPTYRRPTAGDRGRRRWRSKDGGSACSGSACGWRPGRRPPRRQEKLVISNWDAYMPPDLLERFKAATGIEAEVAVHATNEEIMGKVTASGGKGYRRAVRLLALRRGAAAAGADWPPSTTRRCPNIANLYPEAQAARRTIRATPSRCPIPGAPPACASAATS